MAKTLFKGIKQVKYSTYTAAEDKAGYLWFVRPDGAKPGDTGVGDIYFGSRHYAKVDEAGYAKIESALNGFLGNDSKTVKAYVDDIISGLTVSCIQEAGKPIISVSQTNGKLSAAVGTIAAANVTIADSGSVIAANNVEDALQEIATEIDGMDLEAVGGAGKIITTISEADGVISATAATLNAAAVAQTSEKAAISAQTTVQGALDALADKAVAQEISSADKTVTVTATTGGTDVAVNIDNTTLVKDGTSGVISTSLQLSGVTPTGATVKEEYALVDASGNKHGATIKVYKDSSLHNVALGHIGDLLSGTTAVTEESESDVIVPGAGSTDEALNFVYLLNDGKYKLAQVSLESFLQESEFKKGLEVTNNHEVNVKIDAESESFLTVSASGVKLAGVQDAINSAINALDVTGDTAVAGQYVAAIEETDGVVAVKTRANVADAVLNGYSKGNDGSAVASGDSVNAAISKLENQVDAAKAAATTEVVEGTDAGNNMSITSGVSATDGHVTYTVNLSDVASASGLAAEVAARKAVDGQTGQTYAANTGATYISGATSLNDADVKLDSALKTVDDNMLTGVTAGSGITVSAKSSKDQTISAKLEAGTADTVAAGHIEIAFNANGEMYGMMYYDGDDSE